MNTELAKREDIQSLCKARDKIRAKAMKMFELQDEIWAIKDETSLSRYSNFDVLPRNQRIEENEILKKIDRNFWSHVIDLTNLYALMDSKSREEFRDQLYNECPSFEFETIAATLLTLQGRQEEIFNKSVQNLFESRELSFKSHEPQRFGPRMIFKGAYYYGYGSYSSNYRVIDKIHDLDRIVRVLDGKEPPQRTEGVRAVIEGQRDRPCTLEDDYWKIKMYKNGNVHMMLKDENILIRMNRALARVYGEVLSE